MPATQHVIRFKLNRSGKTVIDDMILGEVVFENANMASDPVICEAIKNRVPAAVVNEALASGLPCIVSDECGCAEDLCQ